MAKRGFYFARLMKDKQVVCKENGEAILSYPEAQIPEYQTAHAAGADFFCAEEVTIPSIWHGVFRVISEWSAHVIRGIGRAVTGKNFEGDLKKELDGIFAPTFVHTGIKASMYEDEVLKLFNRSSNPGKLGLVLANSVGVVDADYFENTTNDGEIMFAFYNFKPWSITLKVGDRIGQGVFEKFLRPEENCKIKGVVRQSGFGSTDNQ